MTHHDYSTAVTRAMERGCSVEEVEDRLINSAPLTDDQKSALWLLAWSYEPVDRQRSFALELIAATRQAPAVEGSRVDPSAGLVRPRGRGREQRKRRAMTGRFSECRRAR